MRKILRWIEEAEARRMCEFAAMQRAAAEVRPVVAADRRLRCLSRWLRTFSGRPSPRLVWSHVPGRRSNGV
jgi:hypothetical protein